MKHDSLNRRIAKELVRAQAASDAGKGIHVLDNREDRYRGYSNKEMHIMYAISLINKVPFKESIFRYYVSNVEPDQNGCDSIISYFEFKIGDTEYQMSFHTPLGCAQMCGLINYRNKGCRTSWDGIISGSRTAALCLNQYFGIGIDVQNEGDDNNRRSRKRRLQRHD